MSSILEVTSITSDVIGLRGYVVVIVAGILARIALLASFVLVIKVAVWTLLSVTGEMRLPIWDISLPSEFVLYSCVLLIPAVFTLAGGILYFADARSRSAFKKFSLDARQRQMAAFSVTLVGKESRLRRDKTKEFMSRTAPEFGKNAEELAAAVAALIQSSCIATLICIGFAWKNAGLLAVIFILLSVFIPTYVRKNYEQAAGNVGATENIREARASEIDAIMLDKKLYEDDPESVRASLAGAIGGSSELQQKSLEDARILGARKTLPFVYCGFGVILSFLLWQIAQAGLPIESNKIGDFVILALLLRFFVGELNAALGATRRLNAVYSNARLLQTLYRS